MGAWIDKQADRQTDTIEQKVGIEPTKFRF